MQRNANITDAAGATFVNALTVTAFPPIAAGGAGVVPDQWVSPSNEVVPQFDLELWSAGSTNLTLAELFAARTKAQTISDDAVDTVDFANDELDITAHAYLHGDGPVRISSATTLPDGLVADTDYWVIFKTTGTIQLAASLADALAGTAVAIADGGTGTHTIADTADTTRLYWLSVGLLGHAQDGSVSLLVDQGYRVRVDHSPRTVAYCLNATFSAAVAVTMQGFPVFEG